MFCSWQFVFVLSIFLFMLAWAVFAGGAIWSSTYYAEYYCGGAGRERPDPTNPPDAFPSRSYDDPREEADDRRAWSLARYYYYVDENGCMPAKPIRRYFPMKARFYSPGFIVTAAWLLMWVYSFRYFRKDNVPVETDDSDEATSCAHTMNCCRYTLLVMSVVLASIGFFIAVIFLILMLSFVEVHVPDQYHVMVPTLAVLCQCMLLIAAIVVGYLSKWIGYRESEGHSCYGSALDEFHES